MEEHGQQAADAHPLPGGAGWQSGGEPRGSGHPHGTDGPSGEGADGKSGGEPHGSQEGSMRQGVEVVPEKEVEVVPETEEAKAKGEMEEGVEKKEESRRPDIKGGKRDTAPGNITASSPDGKTISGEYIPSPAESAALAKAEAYRQAQAHTFRKRYRLTSKTKAKEQRSSEPETPKAKEQRSAEAGGKDTPAEKPKAKARAKRGTAGTFCGRKPPQDPQLAEEFRCIRDAWMARQAAAKATKVGKKANAKANAKETKTAKVEASDYLQQMKTTIATLKKTIPNKAGSWYVQEANKQIAAAKEGVEESRGGKKRGDQASRSRGEEEEEKGEDANAAKTPDGCGTWKRSGNKWEVITGEEEGEEAPKDEEEEEEEAPKDEEEAPKDEEEEAPKDEEEAPKDEEEAPKDEDEDKEAKMRLVAKRPVAVAKQPAAKRPAMAIKSQRRQFTKACIGVEECEAEKEEEEASDDVIDVNEEEVSPPGISEEGGHDVEDEEEERTNMDELCELCGREKYGWHCMACSPELAFQEEEEEEEAQEEDKEEEEEAEARGEISL